MKKKFLFIMASAFILSGCAIEGVATIPDETVVARTESPYADGIWIGTEYNWVNGAYVAVPAHWERSYGRHYDPGRWNQTKKGYRWQRGRWH